MVTIVVCYTWMQRSMVLGIEVKTYNGLRLVGIGYEHKT